MTKPEIIQQLILSYKNFSDTIKAISQRQFATPVNGKWSPGQQLDHMVKSIEPLNMGLGFPKFFIRLFIGTSSKPSRSYEQIVADYQNLLQNGLKAGEKYLPEPVPADRKDGLAYHLEQTTMSLCESIEKFSEKDLDTLRLPHPSLGKLTIREMLYFTIYHAEHHRAQMLKNLQ